MHGSDSRRLVVVERRTAAQHCDREEEVGDSRGIQTFEKDGRRGCPSTAADKVHATNSSTYAHLRALRHTNITFTTHAARMLATHNFTT